MEEISHVSHKEHQLNLIKVGGDYEDDDDIGDEEKTIVCGFCKQNISNGSDAYGCIKCDYFMHKTCALLTPFIINDHHLHPKHPLKLIVAGGGDDEDNKKIILCRFCEEPISSGSAAYGCIICDKYLMHKTCAQVEPRINLYLHPQHPLILQTRHRFYGSFVWSFILLSSPEYCDVCSDVLKEFSYNCESCNWNACKKCVAEDATLKYEIGVNIEHEGHPQPQHTLALLKKRGAFTCDACRCDDKDLFYQCNNCPFSIHKTCATLAPEIRLPHYHHPHPLRLAYQLPERFHRYKFKCAFCDKRISRSSYVYHCPRCRYFAHIKCALNTPSQSSAGASSSSGAQENDDDDVMHFPMSKALTQPLKLLLHVNKKKASNDDDGPIAAAKKEINDHWSHPHHPLVLVDTTSNIELQIDPIIVCYGCVRPLSLPYYRCKVDDGCRFFLHKYCAELPRTLEKHPLHPRHSLDLSTAPYYECDGCFVRGNSFLYRCKNCSFDLDVNCAFLPIIIKHESHNHPLYQEIPKSLFVVEDQCGACNLFVSADILYSCKVVGCGFKLHRHCALMAPRTSAHRYCKGGGHHQVPLRYPPIDHVADFFCDICEEEIDPRFWMYYCDKCDNSFHSYCLERRDQYENYNFQGTITVPYHKHPLTYARRIKTPRYVCFSCNQDINGHLILECRTGTCPFTICVRCHRK